MSDVKWTPGPWKVFTPEDYRGPYELPGLGVESENGEAVVWYCSEPETGLGRDADAHLIAAAPELYQELENLVEFHAVEWGPNHPSTKAARAALAKARGEQQ